MIDDERSPDTLRRHDATPMPERIGPYRVEQQIGVGGMGAVYRAFDERLDRAVALKRIHRKEESDPEHDRKRLLGEARAIARVSHPNIVQVYDVVEHEDCDWIVMELVDGLTLRQLVRRDVMEVKEVLNHAQGIALGLAAAHARGIVHRDLKTENVIVAADGTAKILDFGIARWTDPGKDSSSGERRLQGTPRCMSPEQTLEGTFDHRSDLFSFGVLLYECLSGVSPFYAGHRKTYQTLWKACTHKQDRLCELSPAVPVELSDLVDRLLEKEPDDRPDDAEEVLLALRRIGDAPLPKLRVLFVDDEPDFEPLIKQWFRFRIRQQDRYELVFAHQGKEALRKLATDPSILLVFTDLNMPEMNGLSLLGELGKLERQRVAVVVSAYGDMDNIRSAMNLGAYDFLTKPLDFQDLEVTLEKATRQVTTVHEGRRLRAENELLEERNRVIRVAFSRYLRGDPEFSQVFQPLVEQLQSGAEHHVTLLTLEIERFSELPERLSAARLFELNNRFVHDLIAAVHRSRGSIVRFQGGRVSIGFGFAVPHAIYGEQAKSCAVELRRALAEVSQFSRQHGGPSLGSKLVIDAGDVMIDGRSGEMSGEVLERAERQLRACALNEILVAETVGAASMSETLREPQAG